MADELWCTHDIPPLLSEIPDPPKELWIRGKLPSHENKWLAVVGSRKCSQYGKDVCEHLIGALRGYPLVIVSGLALGIDAIAHRAALRANLTCVGVPGSGLDWNVLYPRTNHTLAKEIVASGGALISEFSPKTPAAPWTFPQRNRIMAGISHATLLIEAGERSGTLITARLATEYNRELLAVPGSIFTEGSKGTHQFIKLGATPITEPADILKALGIEEKPEQQTCILKGDQKRVYELLSEPLERDELIRRLAVDTHMANTVLMEMELDGVIVETGGVVRKV